MPRRISLLSSIATVSVVPALLSAPAARADRIAFSCGPAFENVCAVAPDGSARETLLSGATGQGTDRYASPSLAASGARLAYMYKGQAYVKDLATGATAGPELGPGYGLTIRFRPDGGAIALGELRVGSVGGSVCVYAPDLTGRNCQGTAGSYGFAASGDVLASSSGSSTRGGHTEICRFSLADTTSGCDGPPLITDPLYDLSDPTTSPNGRWIAVTRAASATGYGRIAIYDATTLQLVREVSAGPDAYPTWSPDSASVAFDRQGGGIWTASATGTAGAERQLVTDGRSPTWGGGGAATGGGGTSGGGGTAPGSGGDKGGGTVPPGAVAKATCRVPRLTGLSLAAAQRKLKTAGCAAPVVTRRRAPRARRGKVLVQRPAAGTSIARTRHVILVVGRA